MARSGSLITQFGKGQAGAEFQSISPQRHRVVRTDKNNSEVSLCLCGETPFLLVGPAGVTRFRSWLWRTKPFARLTTVPLALLQFRSQVSLDVRRLCFPSVVRIEAKIVNAFSIWIGPLMAGLHGQSCLHDLRRRFVRPTALWSPMLTRVVLWRSFPPEPKFLIALGSLTWRNASRHAAVCCNTSAGRGVARRRMEILCMLNDSVARSEASFLS
jgi:hypothetical protein